MAEVQIDPTVTDPPTLYRQGMKAFTLRQYATAVEAFGQAAELLTKQHGDDLHESLGDVYHHYGRALLELSRSEVEPLGDGVPRSLNPDDNDDEEEVDDDDGETNEEEKGEEGDSKEDESSESKEKDAGEGEKVDEKMEVDGDAATGSGAGCSTAGPSDESKPGTSKGGENDCEDTSEDKEEEATDLQLAWEVLELAKKIYEKQGEEGKKSLAETLISLGEISLENEKYEDAIKDMTAGLEIQIPLFENDSRTLAETYYKMGIVYGTNTQLDEAIDCFEKSLGYLRRKVESLEKKTEKSSDDDLEIKDIQNLLPAIQEKITDMKNCKIEVIKLLAEKNKSKEGSCSMNGGASSSMNGAGASAGTSSNGTQKRGADSSDAINDISHLVKRRKKEDES